MQPEVQDFIHRYPNKLTKKQCEDVIAEFEKNSRNHGKGRVVKDGKVEQDNTFKVSTDLSIRPEEAVDIPALNILLDAVNECCTDYLEYYDLTKGFLYHSVCFNIQKYEPSEGFYAWHHEADIFSYSDRELVWMVYLNDIDMLNDGGGTKFLRQDWVEAATAGKVLIWPAYFTHEHKGQTSHTKTKYIATGWFNSQAPQP